MHGTKNETRILENGKHEEEEEEPPMRHQLMPAALPAKYRNIAKLKYWSNPVAGGRIGMTVEKQRADNITNDSTIRLRYRRIDTDTMAEKIA